MQKVIVFEPRLGLEHLGPLVEPILVTCTMRATCKTSHPSGLDTSNDLSRRPSGQETPQRPGVLACMAQLAQLDESAKFGWQRTRLRCIVFDAPVPIRAGIATACGIGGHERCGARYA